MRLRGQRKTRRSFRLDYSLVEEQPRILDNDFLMQKESRENCLKSDLRRCLLPPVSKKGNNKQFQPATRLHQIPRKNTSRCRSQTPALGMKTRSATTGAGVQAQSGGEEVFGGSERRRRVNTGAVGRGGEVKGGAGGVREELCFK